MWIINPQEGGETHYLLTSKTYVVGRKNCDILLSNDQSISRAHAHLTVTDQCLTLTDTSKYGTFVNDQRLVENQPQTLNAGDKVTFGVFQSKFSVDFQSLVVCSSCVDNGGKASLTGILQPLGGRLVNAWSQDCTHLVMPAVKVTIKTISALLSCRPIVKQDFFAELSKAVQQKKPPPDAARFLPEIDEPSLNNKSVDLRTSPERKSLFVGKTFVFLSAKQLKRLSCAVSFGGGRSQVLEEGSVPRPLLESPQSCVVDMATANTQTMMPTSTKQWAESVEKILQEAGHRFIPESEIGLAAIYASCDKYCNPSNPMQDSESMFAVKPTIQNATLSQTAAVNETILPGASMNITAYVENTEPMQKRMVRDEASSLNTVYETPEKRPSQSSGDRSLFGVPGQEAPATCTVSETMRSSFNHTQNPGTQTRKPAYQPQEERRRNPFPKPMPKMSALGSQWEKRSPQKQKIQNSPQKQSTLTSFFQTVNKKRPLEDDSSAPQSEPKRSALLSSPIPSRTTAAPSPASICSEQHSDDDLFCEALDSLSGNLPPVAPPKPQGRKRKEPEEGINMEELESIMSADMEDLEQKPSATQSQKQLSVAQSSTNQTQHSDAVGRLSSNKRLRVSSEEHSRANQNLRVDLEESSATNGNNSLDVEERTSSVKRQQTPSTGQTPTNQRLIMGSHEGSSSNGNRHLEDVKDEEVSFTVDPEPCNGSANHKAPDTNNQKTVSQVSETREDLPRRLLMVEFRSLTVAAPAATKPQQACRNGTTKNFKRFRKVQVPGSEGLPHIIGGSDLLAHSRGTNSELEEWLKDTAEEESQNRRDEMLGDDLFRYNPTKVNRR